MAHFDPTVSVDVLNATALAALDTGLESDETFIPIIIAGVMQKLSLSVLMTAIFPSDTTTNLELEAAAVNVSGKFAGKHVWNSTTGILYIADSAATDGTWSTAAGVATHTPV